MTSTYDTYGGLTVVRPDGFTGFAKPTGSGALGALTVGEALGEQEAREGRPFVEWAPAGAMLERLLRRLGVSREQLRIANVVWSRPPSNWLEGAPWETQAIEAYRPLLERVIAEMNPKVIVPLGNVALRWFCPGYGGKKTGITAVRGSVLPSPHGWVVPTYHTSYLVQGNHHLSGVWLYDFRRALEVAAKGFERHVPTDYILHPDYEAARNFFDGFNPERHILSYDIETPESSKLEEEEVEEKGASFNIIRTSFCYETGRALTMPWAEPFIGLIREVLAKPWRKRGFNSRQFDDPRLKMNGCPVRGRLEDLMWLWHHLQPTLPRNLQFVTSFYWADWMPWKHTSESEPELYAAMDADATHRIGEGIEADLRKQGMWEVAERHVTDTLEVIGLMSENGLPVDEERRLAFKTELEGQQAERIGAVQALVPDEVRTLYPKEGYKKVPREGATPPGAVVDKDESEAIQAVLLTHARLVERKWGEETRWAWLKPFNPNSHDQVLAYMRCRKHPVPIDRKKKRPTTDEGSLKRLGKKTKDDVYRLTLECRKLTKVIGTYVEGWKPGEDGCVHPVGGFWGAMHRISWRRPNAGATIQDKDEEAIAQGFRKCVRARPGYVFVESDWRGIEAVLVGYFAQDTEYQRLARLGVHSFVLSHLLGRPAELGWSDADLSRYFGELKRANRQRYDDAKHSVHAVNYGATWKTISETYHIAAAEAKRIVALYFDLFPKVRRWQMDTIRRAGEENCLRNVYNYVMWFWDVHRWDSRRRQWLLGEDAKSAVSFLPRDTAAGMLKEALLKLRPLAECGYLRNSTHDSILTHQPESEVDETARRVREAMEAPVSQLGGLVIGVEQRWGPSWHDAELRPLEASVVST